MFTLPLSEKSSLSLMALIARRLRANCFAFLVISLWSITPLPLLAAPITGTFEIGAPTFVPLPNVVVDKLEVIIDNQRITLNLGVSANDTQQSKAERLKRLLNRVKINNIRVFDADIGGLNPVTGLLDVNFEPRNANSVIKSVKVISDNSKEGSGGARNFGVGGVGALPNGTTQTALIDFHGEPTGTDGNRFTSVFQSSIVDFGLDTLLASSNVSYSNLLDPSLDGVLTETYNQLFASLPTSMQSNLTLDLLNDQIEFAFPGSIDYGGAVSFSSDLTTISSAGDKASPLPTNLELFTFAAAVPEPSTGALLSLGIFALLVYTRRRACRVV